MSITNSNLASQIIKQEKFKVGTVHFFNYLAVMEFNEGSHVDLSSARPVLQSILNYFGQTKSFGLVANKVNSYSVSLLDIKELRQALPNLSAYGIVSYNSAGRMNANIESSVCEWDDICFDNLHQGLDTVYAKVKDKIRISLN